MDGKDGRHTPFVTNVAIRRKVQFCVSNFEDESQHTVYLASLISGDVIVSD